jgi:hypothetical protein
MTIAIELDDNTLHLATSWFLAIDCGANEHMGGVNHAEADSCDRSVTAPGSRDKEWRTYHDILRKLHRTR